ncbi:hypothetical protein [Deinococcus hopiensis]|uniref:Uncharacterized protein n=1 Tax=Deinococcus hopiensis KR-140 TaxID=695939 RepID=A0A1W1UB00_9DEIO|nr:hypothetical protein [Deinococcus hopiensis]SMB78257.1 hypothetical protein SAMN00790413_06576 [Deinococcus hopiensis KR-140]
MQGVPGTEGQAEDEYVAQGNRYGLVKVLGLLNPTPHGTLHEVLEHAEGLAEALNRAAGNGGETITASVVPYGPGLVGVEQRYRRKNEENGIITVFVGGRYVVEVQSSESRGARAGMVERGREGQRP